MKIGGKDVTPPKQEFLVLPRGEDYIVFKAQAVPNMDEFNALCPEPQAPMILTKKGEKVKDEDDVNYRKMVSVREEKWLAYLVLKTLEPSEIEWTSVDINEAGTWVNWRKDLLDAGLTQFELNLVIKLVTDANSLTEDRLREAREVFQRGHQPS